MRLSVIIVYVILLGTSQGITGQTINERVVSSLERNDHVSLVECFHSMTDLQIPGYSGSFSQSQASVIMKKFLTDHPVASISLTRNGNNSDGSKFALGELVSGGRKYRLHFVTREIDGKQKVMVLKITST